MADSPSVPPSVQAWERRVTGWRLNGTATVPAIIAAGDDLCAEVLRLAEENDDLKASRGGRWNGMTGRQLLMLCSDHENAIEILRAEVVRLTEALETFARWYDTLPTMDHARAVGDICFVDCPACARAALSVAPPTDVS